VALLGEPKILQEIPFSRRDRGRGTDQTTEDTEDTENFGLCGYRAQKYFLETAVSQRAGTGMAF
jgi:hypothetical protein